MAAQNEAVQGAAIRSFIIATGCSGLGCLILAHSANCVPIYVSEGLRAELDHSRLANIGNITPG